MRVIANRVSLRPDNKKTSLTYLVIDASDSSLLCPLTFFVVTLCSKESMDVSSDLAFKCARLAGLCLLCVLLESPFGLDIISKSEDVVVSSSSP